MSWKLLLSEAFEKQARKLNSKLLDMTYRKLQILLANPTHGKALTGELKGYRVLKISKYRILYRIENNTDTIRVESIELREKGYDRFKRTHAE